MRRLIVFETEPKAEGIAVDYADKFQPLKHWIILWKTSQLKGFFQFEIIINVIVSSFWFIWIPMLWVYGQQKYFYSYSAGINFSRQNLTSDSDNWSRSPHCKGY